MQTQPASKPRFIWMITLALVALLVSALSGVLLQAQDTVELSCYNRIVFAPTQTAQAIALTATPLAATSQAQSTQYAQTVAPTLTAYALTATPLAATVQAQGTQYAQTLAPTWTAQALAGHPDPFRLTATELMRTATSFPRGTPIALSGIQSTATSLAQIFAATPQPPFVGVGMTATVTGIAMMQQPPLVGIGLTATAMPTATLGLPAAGAGGGGTPIAMTTQLLSGSLSFSPVAQPTVAPVVPVDMFFEDYSVNPFVDTATDNLSTFAMDVDTASYTLTRNYLLQSALLPEPTAIRPEEFINYFPTNYGQPQGNDAFALYLDAAPSPFSNDGTLLMRVGLQGRSIAPEDRDPVLLIFVVDVSGSMGDGIRMEMVRDALRILAGQMREDDYIGIVTFSDTANRLLEPAPASEIESILSAIDTLQPTNGTNAEAGICYGYQMATENLHRELNTRVIFLSDGVANVGFTQPEEILDTIEDATEHGITLTSIGVGMGNFNDVLLEQIANDGEGNYYYVDNVREARRIFVNNLVSTLQVIAYDARIQVEFNPETVSRYRLIGYENRAIADADFRADATVDAAEIGAGHTITALYEVELNPQAQANSDIATAFVRYEDAPSRDVVEVNATLALDEVAAAFADAPEDFRLLAAVAEFAELLRQSPFAENTSYGDILEIVTALPSNNPDIGELVQMIVTAEQLSQQ
jgi:Ca-activated chloride channel family protein